MHASSQFYPNAYPKDAQTHQFIQRIFILFPAVRWNVAYGPPNGKKSRRLEANLPSTRSDEAMKL